MKRIYTIFLLLQTTFVFSQKLTTSDSIALSNTWNKLVKDFTLKKTNEIKQYCYLKINCSLCFSDKEKSDLKIKDDNVSADTFITKFYKLIPNSKIWTVITSEKPVFGLLNSDLYEVLVHTYKKDELTKGHEGGQDIFQFKKEGNSFFLFGVTSVP